MDTQLIAAQPPYFTEFHAATIAAAVPDYPDAAGLLVHIPLQSALVAAPLVDGFIDRWVIESPVSANEIRERHAQLARAGMQYVCLTTHSDRLVPLDSKFTH